jgi:DNA repair protein RadD
MGRALRLSERKHNALVLDFAGNIDRHRDWDNPVLLEAVKQTIDRDNPLVIQCPRCETMNTEHARRCMGMPNNSRCDYFFEFKKCESCDIKNDIAARNCRNCGSEIIDPNNKLSMLSSKENLIKVKVLEAKYSISGTFRGFRISALYKCKDDQGRIGDIAESYAPINDRAKMVFYGQFVKKHCENASSWYRSLNNRYAVEKMIKTVNTPHTLIVYRKDNKLQIRNKVFV